MVKLTATIEGLSAHLAPDLVSSFEANGGTA
jgi:hypothetical protein